MAMFSQELMHFGYVLVLVIACFYVCSPFHVQFVFCLPIRFKPCPSKLTCPCLSLSLRVTSCFILTVSHSSELCSVMLPLFR